jgi:hypothetical protein
MSIYPPPPTQQGSIFDPSLWIVSDVNGVSVEYLNANYLQFPVAQGFETLSGVNNFGSTTISQNLVLDGTYLTNYIEFPDGTKQYSAGGTTTGYASLADTQEFTGQNTFNNSGGIIIENTPASTITTNLYQSSGNLFIKSSTTGGGIVLTDVANTQVLLYPNSNGLLVNKGITISNTSNSNNVVLKSDTTTNNQLDITGNLLTSGNIVLGSGTTATASLTFGDGTIQTTAYSIPSNAPSFNVSSAAGQLGSTGFTIWNFNGKFPSSSVNWGDSFFFTLSTINYDPTSYNVTRAAVVIAQGYNITGTGIAVGQNYTLPSQPSTFCYVLNTMSYMGVGNLYFQTTAGTSTVNTPQYTLYSDTNNFIGTTMVMTVYLQQKAV